MGKPRLFFMDIDSQSPYFLPTDPLISHGFRVQFFSSISSFVDNSFNQSRNVTVPSSLAFCEALGCVSRFAGAIVFWFSGKPRRKLQVIHDSEPKNSNPYTLDNPVKSSKDSLSSKELKRSKSNPLSQLFGGKFSSFSSKFIVRISQQIQALLLPAAVVSPLNNLFPNILAISAENANVPMPASVEPRPCQVKHCTNLLIHDLNDARHAVEPRTGIEFPTILKDSSEEGGHFSSPSEVLVGTGAKTMTIIKIKSLRVYAYGFYVQPYSVCEKLSPKYASIPIAELKKRDEFYEDLLREDISMTVRLVVNCNGMKISTVKDAFEKSLRARLVKVNPHTDFKCLGKFGSCFTRDIPLRAGTTIDFRRTEDGRLLTEIGGNLIGAVQSKDLCRAFFDMYIGDGPISEQTKEDIGSNIASIIGRC